MPAPEPLERLSFDAATLVAEHPPVLRHTNKLVVMSVACAEGCGHSGTIGYTRWAAMPLAGNVDLRAGGTVVESRPTIYDYEPVDPDAMNWATKSG